MENKKHLELRKEMKNKKPSFKIKESKFSARVKSKWRFPRGKHSKVRQMHKGRQAMPTPGYGAPKSVRGLTATGLLPIIVNNKKDLLKLNPLKESAIVSATLGTKKKIEILKLAHENKLSLVNVKNITKQIKLIEDQFNTRKKAKNTKKQEKTRKEQEKKKKIEGKKQKENKEEIIKKSESNNQEKSLESAVDNKVEEQKNQRKEIEKTIIKKQ